MRTCRTFYIIDVEYEFASEVNKSCVKQIMSHYAPKTLYSDVRSRKIAHMKSVDLYVCGFPCVPFSHLGKREGINNENCGDVVFGALNYIKQKKPIVSSLLVPVISLISLPKVKVESFFFF